MTTSGEKGGHSGRFSWMFPRICFNTANVSLSEFNADKTINMENQLWAFYWFFNGFGGILQYLRVFTVFPWLLTDMYLKLIDICFIKNYNTSMKMGIPSSMLNLSWKRITRTYPPKSNERIRGEFIIIHIFS